jgi:hypothetical protein
MDDVSQALHKWKYCDINLGRSPLLSILRPSVGDRSKARAQIWQSNGKLSKRPLIQGASATFMAIFDWGGIGLTGIGSQWFSLTLCKQSIFKGIH